MNVLDLFSGGGGLTEGFLNEGFKIIAHIEKDKWACETLKTRIIYHYLKDKNDLNLYNEYLFSCKDYKRINEYREKIFFSKYPELKKKLSIEILNDTFGNPEEEEGVTSLSEIIKKIEFSMKMNKIKNIDLIIGGPPCQAYSLVGRGVMKDKIKDDKRNFLFRYYKEIVNYFKPKAFIFENVPGILTASKGEIYKTIENEFKDIGYKFLSGIRDNPKQNVIDTSELGIPQSRKRVILFGFKDNFQFPYPDFNKYKYHFGSITTRAAIGDLPKIKQGHGKYGDVLNYDEFNLSDFQCLMRKESVAVFDHQARTHNERDLRIYKLAIEKASKGETLKYTDIPKEDQTHKNKKAFLDRFKVHWWDNIPHTILAHLAKDGHYNIHPDINQCRSLTVREAARIQTFPDNYKFEGPRTAQYTQIGNAVPPLFSQIIAKALKDIL